MKGALAIPTLLIIAFAPISSPAAETAAEVVPRDEVRFQPLNPARGDASPKAGVLWGDIRKDVPTGTLIEFVGGFASPPHIHNITYRGVVISGSVHNDDPEAEIMLMGPGSFWTQPAGEPHITTAGPGEKSTAFLEIFSGPYLVKPAPEAFDNGERPVNLEARNVVWLDASDVAWIDQPAPPHRRGRRRRWPFSGARRVTGKRTAPSSSCPRDSPASYGAAAPGCAQW